MAETLKSAKEELAQLTDSEYGNGPTTSIILGYIQILNDYKLYRLVIKKVDECLPLLLAANDYSSLIHAEYLKYKSIALWKLRESKKDVYIKVTDELLTFIEASLTTKRLDQLALTIEILKLRVEVFKFYDKKIQRDSCNKLLVETIEEEQKLRESFLKESSMQINSGISDRITPLPYALISKTLIVMVRTYIPIQLSIRYDIMPRSVKQVINDITKKCWLDHGAEPVITHLVALGRNIYPKDDIEDIMKKNVLHVEAFSKEIVHKTPLQLYHNAASRLRLDQSNAIKLRLFKQNSTHMILDNLNLTFDQKELIKPVLQHSTLLQVLDLSSNCLDDQDLKLLLNVTYKGLTELKLRNNLLTVECLSSILPFPHLRVLDLSYNALGPGILLRLPHLLEKLPSLREIKLSSTHLGDFIKLDPDVKEAYITYAMTSNNRSRLKLDLSNNHFYKDMLCNWTTLWINLSRTSRLHLSNISSDTNWDNFQLLSDLPK
ncbi:hypothetical protein HPULCUR_003999 [Helicostylum pulchrum]|uniref:Uncharacterized protein n=1 Tax=Helicostylum pulchrum TaxID=562976 RepID=A0ABP9XUZ2_9FUNG